ncbi:MAG: TetR/AcrR family transcriptional regulator [Acidimicrobiales bacterium]
MRLPAPERRQQLLDTARMVFARSGFHETSMNDVAAEAGVTKPVLYQHFASKRDLFRAVLDDVGRRLEHDIIQSAAKAMTPREQVERGLSAYLQFVETDGDGFRLLFTGTSREDDEWVRITQRVEGSIARSIADLIDVPGMSTERRITFAHGMVGLAEGMVRHSLAADHDVDSLAADMATLAWGGLRGLGSTG